MLDNIESLNDFKEVSDQPATGNTEDDVLISFDDESESEEFGNTETLEETKKQQKEETQEIKQELQQEQQKDEIIPPAFNYPSFIPQQITAQEIEEAQYDPVKMQALNQKVLQNTVAPLEHRLDFMSAQQSEQNAVNKFQDYNKYKNEINDLISKEKYTLKDIANPNFFENAYYYVKGKNAVKLEQESYRKGQEEAYKNISNKQASNASMINSKAKNVNNNYSLTQQEIDIARKYGISPENYAKQKERGGIM